MAGAVRRGAAAYHALLDDDAGGVARVVDRREADEQPVVAEFPRSALTVAGAEPADLRGARLARHRDAVERQAAAHRGARAIDDEVHALAPAGERSSEERRGGNKWGRTCRSRWWQATDKNTLYSPHEYLKL